MERRREPSVGKLSGGGHVRRTIRVRERPRSRFVHEEADARSDLGGDAFRRLMVEPEMTLAMATDHLPVRAHARHFGRREVERVRDVAAGADTRLDQLLQDWLDRAREVPLERTLQ